MTLDSLKQRKEIICDTREDSSFIDFLQKNLPDYTLKSMFLPVGDYIVNGVIVERKTAGDYIQSLISGRLNDQLANMSNTAELSYLVIIGNIWLEALAHQISRSTIVSSLVGDSFKRYPGGKQGVIVTIQLESEYDFVLFLKYLSMKEKIRLPKLSRVGLSKKDRLVTTVSTFPGWGETLARNALKVYGTIKNLINADPEEMQRRIYLCGPSKANAFHKHLEEKYEE